MDIIFHNISILSFAFRFYHYGRYGGNAGKGIVSPLYIGYPWLIRGYENVSFYQDVNNNNVNANSFNLSHLRGSRILTGNTEIRLPLSGPESLALIRSKTFLIDFNLFFDGGLAWNKGDTVGFDWHPLDFNKRVPVYSAGTSLRVNLFGYIVIEPYYAFPFQNGGWQKGVFGINLVPGW